MIPSPVLAAIALAAAAVVVAAQMDDAAPRAPLPRREQFRVIYEWNVIDYEWASAEDREIYLNTSQYIPQNVLISGINFYGGNLFVTTPRLLDGVPATLATIPVQQSDTAPRLRPFPSWAANAVGDCAALQFVQNIEVDRNGTLWILDNGRVGSLTRKPNATCPPSLVLIDLTTGKNEMQRIPLPADIIDPRTTYLNDLVVDNRRDDDYAYITDNSFDDPGLIVFRRSDRKAWKMRDNTSMKSVQEASTFRINGTVLNLPVNVDGLALGPPMLTADEDMDVERTLYYSPLASYHLYAVNASVLRNESLARAGPEALRAHVRDLGTKVSQTDGMKMDAAGILFYGLIGNSTIAEWNSTTDFRTGQRTIARDPTYIQWVDRFTFDDRGNVYVVINRLYKLLTNTVSPDEVNYRILKSHTGSKSYVWGEAPVRAAVTTTVQPLVASAVTHAAAWSLLALLACVSMLA